MKVNCFCFHWYSTELNSSQGRRILSCLYFSDSSNNINAKNITFICKKCIQHKNKEKTNATNKQLKSNFEKWVWLTFAVVFQFRPKAWDPTYNLRCSSMKTMHSNQCQTENTIEVCGTMLFACRLHLWESGVPTLDSRWTDAMRRTSPSMRFTAIRKGLFPLWKEHTYPPPPLALRERGLRLFGSLGVGTTTRLDASWTLPWTFAHRTSELAFFYCLV